MSTLSRSLVATGTTLAALVAGAGLPVATADSLVAGKVQVAADLGPSATATHLVTLLSGDVIRVDDLSDGTRRGVIVDDTGPRGIAINSIDGKVTAIPHEAMPLVVEGTLDLGLFDVSLLVESGYADGDASALPFVATLTGSARARAQSLPDEARTTASFPHLDAVAAELDKSRAPAFWKQLTGVATTVPDMPATATAPAGIERIWLDRKVATALDESVPYVGAPQAWADGYDGEGVTVAVLDTGIDTAHPDLAGKVVKSENFTFSGDAEDRHGHGTHVASTIAGSGVASGGSRTGVAPNADLLNGKVLADWGSGQTSWIMAGMEWAVAEGADVVSMSLGACCGDGTDVLSLLVDELSAASDTLFVIAAGNDGPSRRTVGMPGTAASALTVGATGHIDDMVAPFSSRGPDGAFHLKPDITAPGVGIVAARAAGTDIGTPVDDSYTALNGTSMATPHVSGAAAILRQQHPGWTAAQVKDALVSTAARGSDDVYTQGGGRLDVERAVRQPLHASGSADFGAFEAPFSDGQTARRQITYTNRSDSPTTLDLSVEVQRLDDETPTSPVSVSPSRLTVPAGGTAEATATVDLAAGPLATYGGWVVAEDSATGALAHTNIGWTKRPEHARLTVTVEDRHGGRVPGGIAWLIDLTSGTGYAGTISNGEVYYYGLGNRPEVPVGHYMFLASYLVPGEDGRPVDRIEAVLPDMVVDDDREFVVDTRQAAQVRFSTTRPTQELGTYRVTAERRFNGHVYRAGSPLDGVYLDTNQAPYVTPTEPVTEGEFSVTMYGRLVGPPLTAERLDGSPRTLEPHYLWCIANEACAPQFDGKKDVVVVDGGSGAAAELTPQRVGGKVALVNPDPTERGEDIALRAEAAGAAGLVFWEDEGFVVSTVRTITVDLPLMHVTASEGAWLTEQTGARFRFAGEHPVPYAFDVAVTEDGQVPDDLSYRPDTSDLATLHRQLRHDTTTPVCAQWVDLPAWLSRACRPTPHAFTHYVLPGMRYVSLTGSSWGADVYEPDEVVEETFDGGPLAPGAVESELFPVPASTRANGPSGDLITFTPGEPLREADRARFNRRFSPLIEERLKVYRNGTLVAEEAERATTVPVPEGSASYRLDYDAESIIPGVNRSGRSHTEWTFRSAHGEGTAALPQLQVEYDVPLDLYNRAAANRRLPVGIGIDHPSGSATEARITSLSLAVSFDGGQTWRDVDLRRRGDVWRGLVSHPSRSSTDGYVAMRVRGADSEGSTVDQTVYQAYALR